MHETDLAVSCSGRADLQRGHRSVKNTKVPGMNRGSGGVVKLGGEIGLSLINDRCDGSLKVVSFQRSFMIQLKGK